MNVPPGQIHSVELDSIYGNNINEQLTKKLSFHFKTIKKLTIRCSVIEGTELCKFISQLINLTHLTVFDCYIGNGLESSDASITLKNIKRLIVENNWSILNLLEPCQAIESVTISNPSKGNEYSEQFSEFFLHHPAIKTLVIKCDALQSLIANNYHFPFQLSTLSIEDSNNLDPYALNAFLCRQKASLRDLEVKRASEGQFWQCIIEELELSKIQAGISNFKSGKNFKILPLNFHLKILVLHKADKTMKIFKEVFSRFPNLEALVFVSWNSKEDFEGLIDHIASQLPNLKHLSLPSLPGIVALVHDFHFLKSLNIKRILGKDQIVNLQFILSHCPRIEILTIMIIEESLISHSMLMFIVSHAKHLTELCLGLNFEYDADAFSIVHRLKNLKKLIIFTKKTEQFPFVVETTRNNSINYIILKSDEKNFTQHFDLIKKV